MSRQTYYELVGDVPNAVFLCATFYDQPTGEIAIHCGEAYSVTVMAFARLDELLDLLETTSDL